MSATLVAGSPVLRLRGATWLSWRQSQLGLLVVAVLAFGAIALLLYDRHQFALDQARLSALHCAPSGGTNLTCDELQRSAFDTAARLHDLALPVLAWPGLVGALLAAQPLAADVEHGRHLLLWSQSISPRRWLTQRLALPATVLLALSTLLSLTVRWVDYWSHPQAPLAGWQDTYTTQALVPSYPLLTLGVFALGALVGLSLHRVIPAFGVTLLGYGLLVYGLQKVWPFLLPLHRRVLSSPMQIPQDSWIQSTGVVLNGRDVDFTECHDSGCGNGARWVRFHPPSEFDPMMWIETGILAALTAVLLVLAYRRLAALTR